MKASNQETSVPVEAAMPRPTTSSHRSSRRKRRVQFEYDDDSASDSTSSSDEDSQDNNNDNRPVKRRVLELSDRPKASLMTQEEKARLWMQPEDHRATLHDVLSIIQTNSLSKKKNNSSSSSTDQEQDSEDPNKVSFGQYAEALAMTFQLCDTPQVLKEEHHNSGVTWNIRTSQLVQQLALWAAHHTCTRGVESKILPGLMAERQRRRTRVITSVLELQQQQQQQQQQLDDDHNNVDARHDSLSRLSLSLTHSAKEFASALAVVDGRQALAEYMAMNKRPQPNHENRVPSTTTDAGRRTAVKRRHEVVTPTEEDRKRNLRRISIS